MYDAFSVFQQYLAIKTHFNSDSYDYFKYHGKMKVTYGMYDKRNDKAFFEKIGRKLDKKEIAPFFVANFLENGDSWIGNIAMDFEQSRQVFVNYKKRLNFLYQNYEEDLNNIIHFLEERGLDIKEVFKYNDQDHPLIFKFLNQQMIEIETFILLDDLIHFTDKYNDKLKDDIIWNKEMKRINKYRPFIKYDKSKVKKITLSIFKPK